MNVVTISSPRNYYVKLDNMLIPNDKKGYRLIQATSGFDLLEKAIKVFELPHMHFQLVSSFLDKDLLRYVRLDQLETIPAEHEFIYLRVR
uniref:Uncharacterized protein n=1 Tax=viral metagenome TaxID=1070528 RepID=A0A6C0KRU1_9ZZZZ